MLFCARNIVIIVRTAQSNGQNIVRYGFPRLKKYHPALQIYGAYFAVTHREAGMNRKLDAQMVICDGARSQCVVFRLDSLIRHPVNQNNFHIMGEMIVE
ncbi:hypothetical protein D3C75_1032500 [compost metagenome]